MIAPRNFWPACTGSALASLAMGKTGWGQLATAVVIALVVALVVGYLQERDESPTPRRQVDRNV